MPLTSENFEEKGLVWQLDLRKKLVNMKMKEGEKVFIYLYNFEFIVRQLEENGIKVEESEKMCWLLMMLPKSYETFIAIFINLPQELQTYESLKKRIINEEKRRDMNDEDEEKVTENKTVLETKIVCYKCGQHGHIMRYCKFNESDTSGFMMECRENMFNLNCNRCNNFNEGRGQWVQTNKVKNNVRGKQIEFIVDSVAPHHMVNNELYFSEYVKLNDPMKLIIAKDNEKIMAVGKGTVEVISLVNNRKVSLSLKNVLHVPDLRSNLLSVKKMMKYGLKIIFEHNKVQVYDESNKCIAVGKGHDLCKVVFQFRD